MCKIAMYYKNILWVKGLQMIPTQQTQKQKTLWRRIGVYYQKNESEVI